MLAAREPLYAEGAVYDGVMTTCAAYQHATHQNLCSNFIGKNIAARKSEMSCSFLFVNAIVPGAGL